MLTMGGRQVRLLFTPLEDSIQPRLRDLSHRIRAFSLPHGHTNCAQFRCHPFGNGWSSNWPLSDLFPNNSKKAASVFRVVANQVLNY
jgi:hypothetical protein